jgi:hypothetical protein
MIRAKCIHDHIFLKCIFKTMTPYMLS